STFLSLHSIPNPSRYYLLLFLFTHPPPTHTSPLSLHDALPISRVSAPPRFKSPLTPPRRSLRSRGGTRRPCHSHRPLPKALAYRSEEHTSELQSHLNLVCRLLLEKKKKKKITHITLYAEQKKEQ